MSEFADYLGEIFDRFGPIQSRRMFGGYGIYHDGTMFGLVADDVLYLKADEQTSRFFEEMGLDQFEYVKNKKAMKMSYYLAPEAIFDDPEAANLWARRAYDAALRSRKPNKKARKSK